MSTLIEALSIFIDDCRFQVTACDADYTVLCLMGSFSFLKLRAAEFASVRSSRNLLEFLAFSGANDLLV